MKNLFSLILSVFALVFTGASAEASKPCNQSPLSFTPYESVYVLTALPQEAYLVAVNPTGDAGYAQQFMHDVPPVRTKVWPDGHRYSCSYGTGVCSERFDRILLCNGQLNSYGHGENSPGQSRGRDNEGQYPNTPEADLSRFHYLCTGEGSLSSKRNARRAEAKRHADRSYSKKSGRSSIVACAIPSMLRLNS